MRSAQAAGVTARRTELLANLAVSRSLSDARLARLALLHHVTSWMCVWVRNGPHTSLGLRGCNRACHRSPRRGWRYGVSAAFAAGSGPSGAEGVGAERVQPRPPLPPQSARSDLTQAHAMGLGRYRRKQVLQNVRGK
jgi:hypothetical protein